MKQTDFLVMARDERLKNHYWLAGMSWEPKEKKSRERARPTSRGAGKRKSQGVEVRATAQHKAGRDQQVRICGYGRVPAHNRHKQLYSLALAFSLQVRDGYSVYQLNSTDYVFLASVNGLPAVTADKTGNAEYMQQCISLFITMNEEPDGGWAILSSSDKPAEVSELLGALTERNKRVCRVMTNGQQLRRWFPVVALFIVAAGGAVWWNNHQPPPEQELTPEEIQARAKAMFANVAPKQITQPWAKQITAQALLSHCQEIQSPAPVGIEGWQLRSGTCSQNGVTMTYQLLPGGTAEGFQKRVFEIFGVYPVFNLKEGGREATVLLPLPNQPTSNEPPTQILRVLSWFQQRQTQLSLNKVSSLPALPGNTDSPSTLGWEDYAFSFKGQVPPDLLMNAMDTSGVRISLIRFEINGSAFSYTTEGHIYASTK
ncbi:type 4b pilus protein PilO2 [Kluyvera cryocrescens]|uniref:Type 4b pilus protein PilO2 n=1 Tax=Kluyvera cryocrescens TaxID=580 RepID=A0AAW9CCI8_KLUCR|nr:type 4b pilus protein PilO2 [Kluyvera cryocrescens]MDW3779658.1 type 4b pilus protein PilO2 [Kluyvera cryocrescens]MEB7558773.1 type 4b pilus protein PilO2 [Kluyvera cryocrescens]